MKYSQWKKLVPNFELEELCSELCLKTGEMPDAYSALALQQFRDHLSSPIVVNFGTHRLRGRRAFAEQLELIERGLSTAENSYHIHGMAFDIHCPAATMIELFDEFEKFNADRKLFGGVGYYKSFLHIDTRNGGDRDVVTWNNQ